MKFSANADTEILNAVRPGLATTGGPLIIASSPYARRGVLWDTHRRHYGPQGDPLILVAQGTSRDFNPALPQRVIDRAMERDAAAASAEYLAQFRTDIESYIAREVIDAATVPGRIELPPMRGVSYVAFTDPSGGSSDSFTSCDCAPWQGRLRDRRCGVRNPATILARGRGTEIFRAAEKLPRPQGHRRSICGRVAAGKIPGSWRRIRRRRKAEERYLSRSLASPEQRSC